ncbi:MAG TPA: DUF898 family protein [Pseudolabrys sp.]|nr:DUF898 family protein [Pseudolabrys sp.]
MDQVVSPPVAPARSARVAFTGSRGDFFRLVRRGAMLELITAGFYRFWLATDMRRALWSGTSLEGDHAEYTGTGKELLIGFLFALAILAPIYFIYFLIGIEAERAKAFASIPLFLFFYAFSQFAIFRARRYRATRTVWRGVRFWMTGSGWAYSWRSCLWGLLILVTLGLALPWRESALERYKMRHLHYGDLQGSFEGTGWGLFKRGWWLWLLLFALVALPFGVVVAFPRHPGFAGLPAVLLLIVGPFAYSAYKAMTWRWWASGIRFGEMRFESDLRAGALMGVYWATIGWTLLLMIADAIVVSVIFFVVLPAATGHSGAQALLFFARQHSYLMFAANLVNYLVFALCLGVVTRVYLLYGVWERVVTSATVHNLERADDVSARGDLASALGEGFADGLDVAGF